MFNVIKTRFQLTLRRFAGQLRDIARAVLGSRKPEHLQGLWRRPVALQPMRVRARRGADRV